jgi:transcriptional regulator of acetoin/glycerol metabolism
MTTPPLRAPVKLSQESASAAVQIACPALDCLSGDDKQMLRLLDQAKRLVNKKVNILLHGETGTGKELIARALHDSSLRASKSFVALNCASIPESLIESELFGYVAGSFTGGRSKGSRGLIQCSSGGTLFLDEIGDMPMHLQTRLLRVLSEGEVMPLGAEIPVPVNLTVVAASHRDLRRLIAEGVFREDLYYRLCGATLPLPPLRLRTDKRYVIERVLQQEGSQLGIEAHISSRALELLLDFAWPGNIRQLRNVIRFALAICDNGQVEPVHLPSELRGAEEPPVNDSTPLLRETPLRTLLPSDVSVGLMRAQTLLLALRKQHWNVTAVANELGVCRATVYRQMKRFNIVSPTQQ